MVLTLFLAVVTNRAYSQGAPETISFQGFVTNAVGVPINNVVTIKTTFYKNGVAGYTQVDPSVTVVDGVFDLTIGPVDTVLFDQPIDLGFTFGLDPEMSPRTPLQSVPYALGVRGFYAEAVENGLFEGHNVVAGATNNEVADEIVGATVSGGGGWGKVMGPTPYPNSVTNNYGTVGGGRGNTAGSTSTVAGGALNEALGSGSSVGGGFTNLADGTGATVGGGNDNTAGGSESTVGGGENNTASGPSSTISGGEDNSAAGDYSTVGGGFLNSAEATGATVAGGNDNTATGSSSTVSGGESNAASGDAAVIGGGTQNHAEGGFSTVGGGVENVASGKLSTVPGGRDNRAAGSHSLAAGRRAKADHDGTFVWADSTANVDFISTGVDQFLIRAAGGMGVGTNAPITQLHVRESINSTASAANHVALIDNSSTGSSADVLALRVARTTDPETTNVFVSFLYSGTAAGVIRGNGDGGVELISSGADYAEFLERLDPSERMEEGDVVSLHSGRISLGANPGERFMVISGQPIVVGNMQHPEREHLYERVAFVGQVPVKVIGSVRAGDLLVASGRGDGSAIALSPSAIRPSDLKRIVGVAWESSEFTGLKKVTAEVGLDRVAAVEAAYRNEITDLQNRLSALEALMTP